MEDKKQIGFSLKRISTEQFAKTEEIFVEGNDVNVAFQFRFGVDFEKKYIAVFFKVIFEQQTNQPFLLLEVGCHFSINEDSWLSFNTTDSNDIIVQKGFMIHLVMLTIGTLRGTLHSKTENTVLNKFILPTINVNEFVDKDITFKIDKHSV